MVVLDVDDHRALAIPSLPRDQPGNYGRAPLFRTDARERAGG